MDAAFSTKEIREIAALPDIEFYMMKNEVEVSMRDEVVEKFKSNRAITRRTEFLLKQFKAVEHQEHLEDVMNNGKKKLILRYYELPNKINLENDDVSGMQF